MPERPPPQVLPNRDSLASESLYGVDGAATVRSTLRYAGASAALDGHRRTGLLRDAPPLDASGAPAAAWARVSLRAPLPPASLRPRSSA